MPEWEGEDRLRLPPGWEPQRAPSRPKQEQLGNEDVPPCEVTRPLRAPPSAPQE